MFRRACLLKQLCSIYPCLPGRQTLLLEHVARSTTARIAKPDSARPGYLLYVPSGLCAFLCYWQYQRMNWKSELIEERLSLVQEEPQEIPKDFSTLRKYQKVFVTGEYVHEDTIFLGPRPRAVPEVGTVNCYFVVTPLYDRKRKVAVLVNRGYVTSEWRGDVERLRASAPPGRVTVTGMVQPNEDPSALVPDNKPEKNFFFWVDIPEMADHVGLPPDTPLIQILDSYPEPRPSAMPPPAPEPESASPAAPEPPRPKSSGSWFRRSSPAPSPVPSTSLPMATSSVASSSSSRTHSSSLPSTPSTPSSSAPSSSNSLEEQDSAPTPFPVPKPLSEIMSFTVMPKDHAVYAGTWALLGLGSAIIARKVAHGTMRLM